MTGLSRKIAKNVNFMALYGGGKTKFMYMMKLAGMPVDEVMTDQFYEEYESEFPEAKQLMKKASKLAERRGFVKTLMGRRARFSKYGENRYYSALNRIIQGSAADIMKIKLLQVYNECRNYFDLRFTVHDSIDGFIIEPEKERLIKEVLDGPIKQFNLKVPIVWKTGIGKTWAEASK
jgi:DNA polymerase-1